MANGDTIQRPEGDLRIVKVGGSLLRSAAGVLRVRDWLNLPWQGSSWIVCGGGELADVVRRWDAEHELGSQRAHALALQTMTLHAELLQSLLPESLFARPAGLAEDRLSKMAGNTMSVPGNGATGGPIPEVRWLEVLRGGPASKDARAGQVVVLDLTRWVMENRPGPECWDFTSDSISAAFALASQAQELVLLKSADEPELERTESVDGSHGTGVPQGMGRGSNAERESRWTAAMASGLVDPCFGDFARHLPAWRIVNLNANQRDP